MITVLLELFTATTFPINSKCKFTEAQAKAILEMRLQRLTAMEKSKIAEELESLALEINGYIAILESRDKLFEIIHKEYSVVIVWVVLFVNWQFFDVF